MSNIIVLSRMCAICCKLWWINE